MDAQPIVAIIPARGGSQRVPRKNAVRIHGKPLLAITVEHALLSHHVDHVYVSTDDPELTAIARSAGAEVIVRPSELAGDRVTSEAVLEHALQTLRAAGIEPGLIAFLQCTSPLRRPGELDLAIDTLQERGADSLLSVTRDSSFVWELASDGTPRALNYDPSRRPRSQDVTQYRENGSIYLFRPWVLDKHQNRLGGSVALYEMDYWSSFEIDTLEDLELCRWRMRADRGQPRRALPHPIELICLDFDGVFTDDHVYVDENGRESVRCSRSDGMGLSLLRQRGLPLLVLSTELNPVVRKRCEKLGIAVRQGIRDKVSELRRILNERNVSAERVIYVGNDVNDLGCMELVGCGVAVADAHASVLQAADWVLARRGGLGAIRELCEGVLESLDREEAKP